MFLYILIYPKIKQSSSRHHRKITRFIVSFLLAYLWHRKWTIMSFLQVYTIQYVWFITSTSILYFCSLCHLFASLYNITCIVFFISARGKCVSCYLFSMMSYTNALINAPLKSLHIVFTIYAQLKKYILLSKHLSKHNK